ncbi:MAG: hypothetical protein GY806_21260 [Gammaproteobacteria bacterium]|nr:hypothetical protein [Gammaproteobacteria bacterium]
MNDTVLVIGHVWPESKSSVAGSRTLPLLRMFKSNGIRVVSFSPAQQTDYTVDLNAESIASVDIVLNDSSLDSFIDELRDVNELS